MSGIDKLNELLWDAEEIGAYANSICEERNGILVATNRRVFFLSEEDLSMKITKNIYVNKIKSVDYGIGILSSWIEIGIGRKRKCLRFDNIDNESVMKIYEYIKKIAKGTIIKYEIDN
jgi:hypothetical protein